VSQLSRDATKGRNPKKFDLHRKRGRHELWLEPITTGLGEGEPSSLKKEACAGLECLQEDNLRLEIQKGCKGGRLVTGRRDGKEVELEGKGGRKRPLRKRKLSHGSRKKATRVSSKGR